MLVSLISVGMYRKILILIFCRNFMLNDIWVPNLCSHWLHKWQRYWNWPRCAIILRYYADAKAAKNGYSIYSMPTKNILVIKKCSAAFPIKPIRLYWIAKITCQKVCFELLSNKLHSILKAMGFPENWQSEPLWN